MTGNVPAPRPGEYDDDGSPVDPKVCNPVRLIGQAVALLAAEGFTVAPLADALASDDAMLGATLLISGLGLTPRVPGGQPQ